MQYLVTGTDSPVSIDSLTTQDPESKSKSHGIMQFSGTTIISPGTRFPLVMSIKFGLRLASTTHSYETIFLIVLMFVMVSYKFSTILAKEIANMQIAYFM